MTTRTRPSPITDDDIYLFNEGTHARMYDKLGAHVIEGATHGGTECVPCETTPKQYSNATKNLFDLMQRWMQARF